MSSDGSFLKASAMRGGTDRMAVREDREKDRNVRPGCQEKTGVLVGKGFEVLKSLTPLGAELEEDQAETVPGWAETHSPGTRWGLWGAQTGRLGSVHRRGTGRRAGSSRAGGDEGNREPWADRHDEEGEER